VPLPDNVDQIWEIQPNIEDKYLGARYAGISLFWTYDRMKQERRNSRAKRNRAFNISKGLVAQRALRRELENRDIDLEVEEKSHRVTDSYDLRFPSHSEFNDLDVKTFNHFTNYGVREKPQLTPKLIAENFDYEGPKWGHFFPLLIPYDQFSQNKDAYCFGISSSIDYRDQITGRSGYELYAYPDTDKQIGQFLVEDIESRESANVGFTLGLQFTGDDPPEGHKVKVIGEWNGHIKEKWISIGEKQETFGKIAGVDSFKIKKDTYQILDRTDTEISVEVIASDMDLPIKNTPLRYSAEDFYNLLMPTDFTIYFIGWITKPEFQQRAMEHPGWKKPSKKQFTQNQKWESMSSSDKRLFSSKNIDWAVTDDGTVRGALRKNSSCYYYPKINRQNLKYGGLQKTNLYVLPGDLRALDDL